MTNLWTKIKEKTVQIMEKGTNWILEKSKMFHFESLLLALVAGWLVSIMEPFGFLFQCVVAAFITMGSYFLYSPKDLDGKKEPFVLIFIACVISLFFGIF